MKKMFIPKTKTESVVFVLKRHRMKRKLSQGVVAKRLGLSQAALCRIERGHNGLAMFRFFDFCKALHVPPQRVITESLRIYKDRVRLNRRKGSPE